MDYNNMLVLSATICFAFLFGRIFVKPIKFIFKVVLNSILGCLLIALQLLSYYISKEKGLDVEKPRNLAKSVTVE